MGFIQRHYISANCNVYICAGTPGPEDSKRTPVSAVVAFLHSSHYCAAAEVLYAPKCADLLVLQEHPHAILLSCVSLAAATVMRRSGL